MDGAGVTFSSFFFSPPICSGNQEVLQELEDELKDVAEILEALSVLSTSELTWRTINLLFNKTKSLLEESKRDMGRLLMAGSSIFFLDFIIILKVVPSLQMTLMTLKLLIRNYKVFLMN